MAAVPLVGGGHPRVDIAIGNTSLVSPGIANNSVYSENIDYDGRNSRWKDVENRVCSLFMQDGRKRVYRNGYTATEIYAQYDGVSGIDALFEIKKGRQTEYLAIESKYSFRGIPNFGPGIQINGRYAEQMSTAWIKIVGHTLYQNQPDGPYSSVYADIRDRPSSVIRAIAVGNGDGNFEIFPLVYGAGNHKQILEDMFKL